LDGAVRDGDGQVRLAAPGRAGEDGGAALADEFGAEQSAQHLHADRGLARGPLSEHGLAAVYLERCHRHAAAPPHAEWVGAHQLVPK
jgi:hypothetical protein